MKKATAAVLTGAIVLGAVLLGGASASAAGQTDELGFGSDHGGAVATTETQSVQTPSNVRAGDGSYWTWGAGGIGGKTFSHYFRERSCHGATAVGKGTVRVNKIAGGRWAKAETPSALSGNKAYYNNCLPSRASQGE